MLDVARQLAQAIVRDGEGATKFITVRVEGGATRRGMPQGGLRDRAFAAGEDGVLRQRPEPGPHPGGGGLRGHRRPGPDEDRPATSTTCMWPTRGGRNPAYREEDGQRVMKQSEITVRVGAGPRHGGRHGLDLRLQPRLRDHQRRLPLMNEKFERLIERADAAAGRASKPILPQPLTRARLERVHRLALPQALSGPRRAGAGAARGRHPPGRPEGDRAAEGEDPAQHPAVRRRASRPTTCC